MKHHTRFWWACPVCLEERTRDIDEHVRDWATRKLKWIRDEYNDEMDRLRRGERP